MQQLRELVRSALSSDDETLDHWIAQAMSSGGEPLPDDNAAGEIPPGCSLAPHSYKCFLYTQHSENTQLYVDGERFTCSESLARAICDQRLLPATLIDAADDADRILIDTLAARELLVPCDSRQH